VSPAAFTTRPELVGSFGMVASTHWLATASGMSVLERGGNAFDAAVATGLVLHVVEPHLNGLGGDAPILGVDAASGRPWVLSGQGVSPAAATPAEFERLGLDLVPGTGHLAAVVPGAFGAWMTLLERFGSLPLRDVMGYAIGYARDGFPLLPQAVATIRRVEQLFRESWPSSAEVYLPAPEPGGTFRNPDLAATLEGLADAAESSGADPRTQAGAARRAFYEGSIADAVDAFVRQPVMDSSGGAHAGLLTGDDLAGWSASFEEPVTAEFAGFTVAKTAAWGQGPVLLQQLRMLESLDISHADADSAEFVHTVLEVAGLAFADREAYYGDVPDVPLDLLLSREYAGERARLVGPDAADPAPGDAGHPSRLPAAVRDARRATAPSAGVGEPTVSRAGETRGDTCHLDVVDRWGNVVSATPSGGWLQSSPVIPGLGFSLPTRAQMFWLEEGLPNSLAPRKRPRTTLSPGLVLRDGAPYLAFGTPGGDQQDQWTVPFLVRHLALGENLQQAIDAPTFDSTHVTSSFYPRDSTPLGVEIESRYGDAVIGDLRRRGHDVTVTPPWSLGRISAAGIRADGMRIAAANPRGMQGYAAGR
jgi:gamma-glutamyltranspeptidase/glutathione hydrolase